jgi:hypothetical protein
MRYVPATEYESPSTNPGTAIGSNVFRQLMLKNQAGPSSPWAGPTEQILFGRNRNQIAI